MTTNETSQQRNVMEAIRLTELDMPSGSSLPENHVKGLCQRYKLTDVETTAILCWHAYRRTQRTQRQYVDLLRGLLTIGATITMVMEDGKSIAIVKLIYHYEEGDNTIDLHLLTTEGKERDMVVPSHEPFGITLYPSSSPSR